MDVTRISASEFLQIWSRFQTRPETSKEAGHLIERVKNSSRENRERLAFEFLAVVQGKSKGGFAEAMHWASCFCNSIHESKRQEFCDQLELIMQDFLPALVTAEHPPAPDPCIEGSDCQISFANLLESLKPATGKLAQRKNYPVAGHLLLMEAVIIMGKADPSRGERYLAWLEQFAVTNELPRLTLELKALRQIIKSLRDKDSNDQQPPIS